MKSNKSRCSQILILGLLVSAMLSGCMGNNSQSTTPNSSANGVSLAQYKTTTNNASIFSVGGTYDSMSDHPTNTRTCLKVGNDINNLQLTDPQALLNFGSTIDSSTLQNALGIDFTATFGWGAFATTTSYHYAKSSQDDDFTMNINYAYQYAGKVSFKPGVLTQGNDVLIPEALSILLPFDISRGHAHICMTGRVVFIHDFFDGTVIVHFLQREVEHFHKIIFALGKHETV